MTSCLRFNYEQLLFRQLCCIELNTFIIINLFCCYDNKFEWHIPAIILSVKVFGPAYPFYVFRAITLDLCRATFRVIIMLCNEILVIQNYTALSHKISIQGIKHPLYDQLLVRDLKLTLKIFFCYSTPL